MRFPNFSDVTTKLDKHVRDQFASGHLLLDSRVTHQVASEAVLWLKLEFKEISFADALQADWFIRNAHIT